MVDQIEAQQRGARSSPPPLSPFDAIPGIEYELHPRKVPCPARIEEARAINNLAEATRVFYYLCPPTLAILEVYPKKTKTKHQKCSWRVEYMAQCKDQPTDTKIVEQLHTRKPLSTMIMWKRRTILPPRWNVEYCVIECKCLRETATVVKHEDGDSDSNSSEVDDVIKEEDIEIDCSSSFLGILDDVKLEEQKLNL